MAVLAFLAFVGIADRQLILPLLPLLKSRLDRNGSIVFKAKCFPFCGGINFAAIPDFAVCELFRLAVAQGTKLPLIEDGVI